MGPDDTQTNRKPDAHVLLGIRTPPAFRHGLEQTGEPVAGNARAVVGYGDQHETSAALRAQTDTRGVLAMINGIFQHIEHYLLNEHSIHVRKQNVVAQIHVHFDIGKVLLKLDGRFGQHVLHDFGFRVQRGCFALNAGDGQLIFNHAQKPLGIGVDIGQQLALLFRRQSVIEDSACRAHDRGQRRAQIMRYGAQQVGA